LLGDLPYLLEAHRLAIPRAVESAPLPARIAEIGRALQGLGASADRSYVARGHGT
jgi:hypothetical protein